MSDYYDKTQKLHDELIELISEQDKIEVLLNKVWGISNENYEKVEAIRKLETKWVEDMETYPDTELGEYCRTVLKLCIKELKEVLGE